MRIAFVHYQDPTDESVWNGTPAYLIKRLRESGNDVVVVGPLHGRFHLFAHFISHIRRRFYRYFAKRNFYVHRDPHVSKARGRFASRILAGIPKLDAVLCVVPSDAAFIQTSAPLFLYFDSTWFQCLDFYGDCMRKDLANATIEGGLEIDRATYKNCTRVIYSSNWAVQSAIRDYGADPARLTVLSLGANLKNTPDYDKLKQCLSMRGQGPCRLLFVGRDWNRKGGDAGLEIARALIAAGIPCEFHVVGCNVPSPIPSFVVPHGFLDKKDSFSGSKLDHLFQHSDFFVCPTRADCQPMVLAEAAAYGMPVVTTNIAGIPEIVPDSKWGITLPVGAPVSLYVDWIKQLFLDRQRYEDAAVAAWKYFNSNLVDTELSRKLTAIMTTAQLEEVL